MSRPGRHRARRGPGARRDTVQRTTGGCAWPRERPGDGPAAPRSRAVGTCGPLTVEAVRPRNGVRAVRAGEPPPWEAGGGLRPARRNCALQRTVYCAVILAPGSARDASGNRGWAVPERRPAERRRQQGRAPSHRDGRPRRPAAAPLLPRALPRVASVSARLIRVLPRADRPAQARRRSGGGRARRCQSRFVGLPHPREEGHLHAPQVQGHRPRQRA